MKQVIDNYRDLFTAQTPLLDLRAPIEFTRGAFSHATNIGLMNDKERELVGTCYKQQGQQAAIALGHQLVSGLTKQQRVERWLAFMRNHPNGVLYCFRGGLRSHTVQQWLADAGVNVPLVHGGYKALRNFLINELEQLTQHPLYLLAGCTGSGKTELLRHYSNSLDLERAAQHRGSSFGAWLTPVATQINFENSIAEQYLQRQFTSRAQPIVLEDEGRLIGSVHLPVNLVQAMQQANVVVVEQPFDYRLARLFHEYVVQMQQQFCLRDGLTQGKLAFAQYLQQGLIKIRKRLGNARYFDLQKALEHALASNKIQQHVNWLVPLLRDYYDPMYRYQLSQKQARIVFQGNAEQCAKYIQQLTTVTF